MVGSKPSLKASVALSLSQHREAGCAFGGGCEASQHTSKKLLPSARKGHLRQTIHSTGGISGPSLRTRETCQFPTLHSLPRRGAQGVTGQKWLDGSTQSSLGVVTLPQAPSCSFSAPHCFGQCPPYPLVLNPTSTIPTKPQPKASGGHSRVQSTDIY